MTRITSEEHISLSPIIGDDRVKGVDSGSLNGRLFSRDPWLKELPNHFLRLHGVGVFVLEEHEFPAAPIVRTTYVGGRTLRVTILDGVVAKLRLVFVEEAVHYKPTLVGSEVIQRDVQMLACSRAGTIASDDQFGGNLSVSTADTVGDG